MKKVSSSLTLVICTLVLSACVQVPVEPQQNNNQLAVSSVRDLPYSYAQRSLFSLSPKYVKETSLKAQQTQNVYKLYTNAIVDNLQKNGFKVAQKGQQASFHVGFGIALSDDLSDEKINKNFGVSPGLPEKGDLKKGSFLIYIEDAITGERVWRGIAQGFAHDDITIEQRNQRTAVIVASVMKQFYQTN
mgnify:CR=1 FL=1